MLSGINFILTIFFLQFVFKFRNRRNWEFDTIGFFILMAHFVNKPGGIISDVFVNFPLVVKSFFDQLIAFYNKPVRPHHSALRDAGNLVSFVARRADSLKGFFGQKYSGKLTRTCLKICVKSHN